MRKALAPILFDDHNKAEAEKQRKSIVAPAKRSLDADTEGVEQKNERWVYRT